MPWRERLNTAPNCIISREDEPPYGWISQEGMVADRLSPVRFKPGLVAFVCLRSGYLSHVEYTALDVEIPLRERDLDAVFFERPTDRKV